MSAVKSAPLIAASRAAMLIYGGSFALLAVSLERVGREFSLTYTQKGGINAILNALLCLALVVTPWGAERYGKRRCLWAGMSAMAAGMAALGLAGSYGAVLTGAALLGAGCGIMEAAVSPLIAELDPPRSDQHLNLLHSFFSMGLVVAALAGSLLLGGGLSWRWAFAGLAVIAVADGLAFRRARDPAPPASAAAPPATLVPFLRQRAFWALALMIVFAAGVEACLTFWTPNYVQQEFHASALGGGFAMALFGALMMTGRLLTSLAVRRLPLPRLLLVLTVLAVATTTGLLLARQLSVIWVLLAASGLCVAPFWPSTLALANRRVPATDLTRLYAALALVGVAGYALMPWLVGVIADHVSLRAALLTLPAACVVIVAVLATLQRRDR